MLKIACCLWYENIFSQPFSRCYDNSWVEKLYRGFKRNLTKPFEFICFTDCLRDFKEPILQERLKKKTPDYGCLIEPFKLEGPLIVCGLDTVILNNIDHLADYCFTGRMIAAPRDPYKPEQLINPVVLVPNGNRIIYDEWEGLNDMQWLRRYPWQPTDDLWPGQIRSLKAHRVRDIGPENAHIIYFHGNPKPHELPHLDWIQQHWV